MSRRSESRRNADRRRRLEGTGHLRSSSDNERLDSFLGWTGQLDPKCLVHVGFSYTGVSDAVQCFSCDVVIQNWTKDMDPLVVHVAYAPHCRHLLRLISADVLAEMKDQIFDNKKMRAPFIGAIKWPCNHFTGERVEEFNSFHGQPHNPSAGQNEPHSHHPSAGNIEPQPHHPSAEQNEPQPHHPSEQNEPQPHHPSAGRSEHHPEHGDSNKEAEQSLVVFSESHKVIERMDIQEGGSDVHLDERLPENNISISGELDAGMDVANGDAVMDDVLNSIAAQSVLQTGYGTTDQVKNAIIDLRRNGMKIFNGKDILAAILETECQVRQN